MSGPKVKFDKPMVVAKSRQFIDQNGVDQVSMRSLAGFIGCSTQPLFRLYQNSEQLLEDVYLSIDEYYEEFVGAVVEQAEMPFLGLGLGYIQFAHVHPNLFYVLFMSKRYKKDSLLDFFQDAESDQVIAQISKQTELSAQSCRMLLRDMWLFTHGIAVMIYTKQVAYCEAEIKEILTRGFLGITTYLKTKGRDHV